MTGRAPVRVRVGARRMMVACAALAVTACDKVPLFAPTQSAITLYVANTVLPLNGVTEVVATVLEQAGTPVQNGTLVTFTATLGSIEPREVRTNAGKVTVRFLASGESGTASIVAFSGSARSDAVEIRIGGAAVARVTLTAQPGAVPTAGGSVTLVAVVSDQSGNRVAGIPVAFTSTAGVLGANTVTTDASGEARTTLTTTRETTVTASAGNQQAQITVAVTARPTVQLTAPAAPPVARQTPATFTVTANAGAGTGAAITGARIDFGDGVSQDLGALNGSVTVSHLYARGGSYTVTASAVDSAGQQGTVTTVIVVNEPGPLNVTITASPLNPVVNSVVSLTANVTSSGGGSTSVDRFEWEFIKGGVVVTRKTTTGAATTYVFGSSGHWVVRVTAFGTFGSIGVGNVEIFVDPVP